MSSDTIGLIDELGVPKHPQQRMLDTLAGRTQGQSDAFANTGGTLVDMVTGTISGMWNFVTSPIDSVRESWNAMKEFDAQGNLLGFQGRDYERGYIQGQGDGNAAIGAVGGEAMAAFGGVLFQGALARASGGNVTVNADANGQATGFSIQDGVGHSGSSPGGATPNLRFGDGDDAGLRTPLVDGNRVVLAGEVPPNNLANKVDGPRDGFTDPYNPNAMRADLEATYGADNVTSTTNPKKPLQTVNSNPDKGVEVINGVDGGKAVRVQYTDPVTGQPITANIPYNDRVCLSLMITLSTRPQ